METGPPQIPNLASILQTLSTYAPRQPTVQPGPSDLEDGEYDPHHFDPAQLARGTAIQSNLPERSTTPPSVVQAPSLTVKPAPPPSASAITTWPKALNHTIKHIFPDPDKKQRIQNLIYSQHKHERDWWASREELVRKAQGRDKSRMQLDSVLASVGGLVATSSRLQGESEGDEMSKDLAVFDRKVHYACRQMADASKKELCELGVPFFCVGLSNKIERQDLEALRKKMLQLLEDYCGFEELGG